MGIVKGLVRLGLRLARWVIKGIISLVSAIFALASGFLLVFVLVAEGYISIPIGLAGFTCFFALVSWLAWRSMKGIEKEILEERKR